MGVSNRRSTSSGLAMVLLTPRARPRAWTSSASWIWKRTVSTSGSGWWSLLVAMPDPSRRRMLRWTWSNQRKPLLLLLASLIGDFPVSAAVIISVVTGVGAVRP